MDFVFNLKNLNTATTRYKAVTEGIISVNCWASEWRKSMLKDLLNTLVQFTDKFDKCTIFHLQKGIKYIHWRFNNSKYQVFISLSLTVVRTVLVLYFVLELWTIFMTRSLCLLLYSCKGWWIYPKEWQVNKHTYTHKCLGKITKGTNFVEKCKYEVRNSVWSLIYSTK